MQVYDILMLVILVGVTLHGALKGMAWQVASLGSIGLSIFTAARFSPALAPWFGRQEPWNRFLAMLVLYLATSLAIWLIFRWVSELINKVKLQQFDHQVGAVFGLGKAILYCLVITFFAVTLSETSRQAVLHARSGYFAAVITRHAAPVLPQEIRKALGEYVDQFNRELDPHTPPVNPAADPTRAAVDEAVQKALRQTGERAGVPPVGK
jgi:membrane protein required for colicin V production